MNFDLNHQAPRPAKTELKIGAIGAGFIMKDVHLVAYQNAGYPVGAICSGTLANAVEAAKLRGVPRVYRNYQELLADPSINVIDIAVPPHLQIEVIREAVRHRHHVKGILAQKPLAMNYAQAREVVELCAEAGVTLAVNQNMRYDQAMRALKTLITRGDLGEPVLATIEMRAIPHWQPWIQNYHGLTLLVMSIHHFDVFRYLFGDPDSIYVSARSDPRTTFPHRDGICLSILEYANGLRASSWDDVWAGPAREGAADDLYIKWRVEGTDGTAQGTIGWPGYPNRQASTIEFTSKRSGGVWHRPMWKEVWFPDAFEGTMGELISSVQEGREPVINGRDNLKTMALVDAAYKSLAEHRPVSPREIEA